MNGPKKFLSVLLREWRKDEVLRHAAAIAYYTVFTLPASFLLILLIAGKMIGRETVEGEVFLRMQDLLGDDIALFIQSAVTNIQARHPSSLMGFFGIVLIILGATGIFRELRYALNKILLSDAPKNRILDRLQSYALSLFLIFITSVVLLSSVFAGIFLRVLEPRVTDIIDIPVITLDTYNTLITFGGISLLFFLLYLVLPARRFPTFPVAAGSIVAGLLFMGGMSAMTFYLSRAQIGEAYGAAASVLILLVWVYWSVFIFLMGAELIDTYVRLYGRKRPFPRFRKLFKKR